MNYILKQYDNDLLYFSMKNTNDGLEVLINTVNQNLQYLLPLDLELNEKDTKGIIDICQGLSLNDSYWVVQENCRDLFKDKNLYHNSFNTNIASIAFTGCGIYK